MRYIFCNVLSYYGNMVVIFRDTKTLLLKHPCIGPWITTVPINRNYYFCGMIVPYIKKELQK